MAERHIRIDIITIVKTDSSLDFNQQENQIKLGEQVLRSFSLTERVIFWISAAALCISTLALISRINNHFLVSIPAHGGTLVEGIVGYPRFINPLLSYTEAGEDIRALVYSGLLKATPEGKLIPDLAKEYSISDDQLTYTFILKDNLIFHDGKPITTEDIEFTIKKAIDPSLKSPERVKWEGVVVEKVNDKTIKFILKNPYTPFLENTTLGILPKHIWSGADLDQFTFSLFNTEPIGSGPYKISKIERSPEGIPLSYKLNAFSGYALGKPKIETIVVKFYPTEEQATLAYLKGNVESLNAISAEHVSRLKLGNENLKRATLPRVFGIFFNQNQSKVLAIKEIRQALEVSLDKEAIVNEVLYGFGTPIDSPIPAGLIPSEPNTEADQDRESKIQKAKEILTTKGWKQNESGMFEFKTKNDTIGFQFTISTSDAPELKKTAELLKNQWEAIGARIEIKIFEQGDFNQSVLRPRKYDALLFGEIVGRDLDLYPFWFSGERNDPGLNIALYANSKVDAALVKSRSLITQSERIAELDIIKQEIKKDIPAIFIYSPDYIYIIPKKVKNIMLGKVINPEERFINVSDWYIAENKVWKIFAE